MHVKVSAFRYGVVVDAQPIVERDVPRMGICDRDQKLIRLSPDCPAGGRLEAFLTSYARAWLYHVEIPTGVVSVCQFTATVAAAAMRELSYNGGEAGLKRLRPGESPEAGAVRIPLTRNRHCGECRSAVAGNTVVCRPNPDAVDQVVMQLYCPHCDHLQTWSETLATGGFPSGEVVGEPKLERGEALARFLREHPECGVILQ